MPSPRNEYGDVLSGSGDRRIIQMIMSPTVVRVESLTRPSSSRAMTSTVDESEMPAPTHAGAGQLYVTLCMQRSDKEQTRLLTVENGVKALPTIL